ncbi:MAG: AtpZ/AtpI family protein [Candidatus Sericytochromatia bacterium]|nr:AtpZ/AtpI family protein [Candidatus Sericytochromatia bacterium]
MVDAFTMLATVVVGLFLGVNLDKVFHTSPFLTITFTFLGIGTTIFSVLKKK